jgi:dTDP-4-dehydrorhamnose 3,5-epimerase
LTARFEILDTPLGGLKVLIGTVAADERGSLERLFDRTELADVIRDRNLVQINRTATRLRGTVRGMHYQRPPEAELKIISCLKGHVFDVAVDLRQGSSTFLRWHGELLGEGDHRSLVIPEGFAHGYQSLADGSELLYLHTATHQPSMEDGVNPLDPRLAIVWPEVITQMSARDGGWPMWTDEDRGLAP